MLVAVTVSLLTTLNPMGMHTFRELQVQRLWGTGGRSEALVRNDSLKGQAFGEYAASFPVDSYHGCRVDFLLRPCRRQVTISCAWFLMLQILLDLSGILESSFSCTRWWCKRRPGPWGVSGEYSQFASCQAEGYQEFQNYFGGCPVLLSESCFLFLKWRKCAMFSSNSDADPLVLIFHCFGKGWSTFWSSWVPATILWNYMFAIEVWVSHHRQRRLSEGMYARNLFWEAGAAGEESC